MAARNAVPITALIAFGIAGQVRGSSLTALGPGWPSMIGSAYGAPGHVIGRERSAQHGCEAARADAGRAFVVRAETHRAVASSTRGDLETVNAVGAETVAGERLTQSSRPPGAADVDAESVAAYRLTRPVFARFEAASRRIAAVTRDAPRYANAPLFSREVAMLGDVRAVAAGLQARLQNDPALAGALTAAKITAREYTTFAIALIAARLAQGFVAAGVLRNVPPGPTSENVAFVTEHEVAVSSVLADLGVNGLPDAAR